MSDIVQRYAVLDFAVSAPDFVERLNRKAAEGWRLVTATRSEKRVLLFMEKAAIAKERISLPDHISEHLGWLPEEEARK
jgi:hypothetical protein